MLIKLFTDAATKNGFGPSAAGVIIVINGKQIQLKHSLGNTDNHSAEFSAAIWAFEQLKRYPEIVPDSTIMFYTDSRIVADAVGKNYAKNFTDLAQRLITLIDQYHIVLTEWLPEKQNLGAHRLALQALHGNNK